MRNSMKRAAALFASAVMTAAFCSSAYAVTGAARAGSYNPWVGSYAKGDGQKITVHAADERHVYLDYTSYSEDGWNTEKSIGELQTPTFASSIAVADKDVYYFLRDGAIEVDQTMWGGGFREGAYTLTAPIWTYKESDGCWYALDSEGNPKPNCVADDGWVTDSAGRWDRMMGMGQIEPGTYQTIWDNESGVSQETCFFSMYTNIEDWHLTDEYEEKEVGTVDYFATLTDGNEYAKEGLLLYNSADGYVLKDAAGEVFGWLYPVGDTGTLMLQLYGEEKYHALNLIYSYADNAG